mgnify:CR=1 FL=1
MNSLLNVKFYRHYIHSISKLILNGPEDELLLTKNTQPAILTVSYSIFKVLKDEFPRNFVGYSDHTKPDSELNSIITSYILGARVIEKHFTLNKYKKNLSKIRLEIDNQNINFYIDYIINSLFEANKYFNDQEPWKKKDNPLRLNTIIYTSLEIVRKVSFLLYPIIPETSLKALKIFNLSEKDIKLETISNNEFIIKGNMISKIDILIKKIEKKDD